MKECVVRSRNGAPQTRLGGIGRLEVREMPGQIKHVLGVCHFSGPRFVGARCLFGLVAIAEIGENAPLLQRLETLHQRLLNFVRRLP
jgi:hypothetical protein